jgi:outer membrane usher protein
MLSSLPTEAANKFSLARQSAQWSTVGLSSFFLASAALAGPTPTWVTPSDARAAYTQKPSWGNVVTRASDRDARRLYPVQQPTATNLTKRQLGGSTAPASRVSVSKAVATRRPQAASAVIATSGIGERRIARPVLLAQAAQPSTRVPVAPSPPVPPQAISPEASRPVETPRARPATVPAPTTRLNPTGRNITIIVPITDGTRALGETSIVLGADDSLRVGAEPLLAAIAELLDPRALERLRGQVAGRRDLSADEWAALNYPVVYNPARIELSITIPGSDRIARRLDVADLDRDEVGKFEMPARLSGFLNVRGAIDYVHTGLDEGMGDPSFVVDGAFRVGRFVVESEGNLGRRRSGDIAFQREGSRIVFDDPARTMRWSGGDVIGQGAGLSSPGSLLGVSVYRNYSDLAPQRFVRPRGEREFVLNKAATVETFVNNRSVRRVRLEPGTYTLRDFPFTDGSNDVRIVIEDDTGVREALNFSLFFDRSLLGQGLTEFGLTGGLKSLLEESGPSYQSDEWVVSGFIRRGISSGLTGGLNFQLEEAGQIAGAEATWGSKLGTIGFDGAISNSDSQGTGYAINATLNRLLAGLDGRNNSLNVSVESRSENFAIPGSSGSSNPFWLQVGVGYSMAFGEFSFAGIDLRHSIGRGENSDRSALRATYGRRIGQALNLSADAIWEDTGSNDNFGFRLTLTYRLGQNSSVRSEYDTASERARLSYQRQSGQGVGAFSLSGDVDFSPLNVGGNLAAGYVANRADLGYAFTTTFDREQSEITNQRSSFRAATSIGFADGAWAIGRPINDSFAIITPHRSLKNAQVLVERNDRGYISSTGSLGGALFPDLSAYSDRSVSVDVPSAPSGYDIGAGSFRLRPGYRTAYRFEVGSDYSVTLIGRLKDRDGQPISLLAGTAVEVAKPERAAITVFTNREGRFALSGARPGEWRITMPTTPPSVYVITVPSTTDNIARLGDLEAK